jgi:hypothetical protein
MGEQEASDPERSKPLAIEGWGGEKAIAVKFAKRLTGKTN